MGEGLISYYHLFVCLLLFNFANFAVYPVTTDVIMEALCPGKDECSLAIYITGFHQAIMGLGSVFVIPLMGNLSDVYGRKALLTIPFTFFIIPFVILAYSRTTIFVYAYYLTKTLSGMVENSVQSLALAYVVDTISEAKRGSLFGMVTGVLSAGMLTGTLAARLIEYQKENVARCLVGNRSRICWNLDWYLGCAIAAISSVIAAVYLQVFLKSSTSRPEAIRKPIIDTTTDSVGINCESSRDMQDLNTTPSSINVIRLLKTSKTFRLAAFVAFFNMLAYGGLQASLFYYLKACFHFNKDQFADIMIVANVSATITQLFFMPILAPVLGDNILLSLGLSSTFVMMLLYSIAWSFWVPFVAALFCSIYYWTMPSLCSIVSKQVGQDDQGMAQGCISSIGSLANILAPLIFSPLTALFLSEGAPFDYPGFSMLCIGLAWLMAFIASIFIPAARLPARDNAEISDELEA